MDIIWNLYFEYSSYFPNKYSIALRHTQVKSDRKTLHLPIVCLFDRQRLFDSDQWNVA